MPAVDLYRIWWGARCLALIRATSPALAVRKLISERGYSYYTPDVLTAEPVTLHAIQAHYRAEEHFFYYEAARREPSAPIPIVNPSPRLEFDQGWAVIFERWRKALRRAHPVIDGIPC